MCHLFLIPSLNEIYICISERVQTNPVPRVRPLGRRCAGRRWHSYENSTRRVDINMSRYTCWRRTRGGLYLIIPVERSLSLRRPSVRRTPCAWHRVLSLRLSYPIIPFASTNTPGLGVRWSLTQFRVSRAAYTRSVMGLYKTKNSLRYMQFFKL